MRVDNLSYWCLRIDKSCGRDVHEPPSVASRCARARRGRVGASVVLALLWPIEVGRAAVCAPVRACCARRAASFASRSANTAPRAPVRKALWVRGAAAHWLGPNNPQCIHGARLRAGAHNRLAYILRSRAPRERCLHIHCWRERVSNAPRVPPVVQELRARAQRVGEVRIVFRRRGSTIRRRAASPGLLSRATTFFSRDVAKALMRAEGEGRGGTK